MRLEHTLGTFQQFSVGQPAVQIVDLTPQTSPRRLSRHQRGNRHAEAEQKRERAAL